MLGRVERALKSLSRVDIKAYHVDDIRVYSGTHVGICIAQRLLVLREGLICRLRVLYLSRASLIGVYSHDFQTALCDGLIVCRWLAAAERNDVLALEQR